MPALVISGWNFSLAKGVRRAFPALAATVAARSKADGPARRNPSRSSGRPASAALRSTISSPMRKPSAGRPFLSKDVSRIALLLRISGAPGRAGRGTAGLSAKSAGKRSPSAAPASAPSGPRPCPGFRGESRPRSRAAAFGLWRARYRRSFSRPR